MKIAIDALPFMIPKTGIGFYAYHLLSGFPKIAPENDYFLCDMPWGQSFYSLIKVREDLSNIIGTLQNILRIPLPFQTTITRTSLGFYAKIFREVRRIEEMDLFFGPNFRGFFKGRLKTVLTIHDMSHEYYPENVEQKVLQHLKKELPRTAKMATLIIADSQNTKKDILRFLEVPDEKVKVVYLGVDKTFRPMKDQAFLDLTRRKYNFPERFILYLGAIQPRKNITGLIRAFSTLCEQPDFKHDLVIAGGVRWKNQEINRLVEDPRLKDRIRFTGYLATSDVPAVYNLAEAFVFPSFYEGFGLPVLEAMACGIPVVTSNVSPLPEVAGDAPIYINPHSVNELTNAIRQILSNENLRNRCIAKGLEQAKFFTWERCAAETLRTFVEAYALTGR